jgi:signal transduction histidine kinase
MANQSNGRKGVLSRTPAKSTPYGARRAQEGARADTAATGELRQLELIFSEYDWPDRRSFERARKRARKRGLDVLGRGAPGAEARRSALLLAASELLVGLQPQLAALPAAAVTLVEQLESVMAISRFALAREVLRAPELLTVSPPAAVEAQLAMLLAFAPLRSVSLWRLDNAEQAACVRHVGEGDPSRRARQVAQRVLCSEQPADDEQSARTLLLGLPIGRWQQPLAALVVTAKPSMRDGARPFIEKALPMLGAILEREMLISGNAESERVLVESSERKLTRLGFDLHDGPIQDVAVIAQDLRALRDRFEPLLEQARQRTLARERFELLVGPFSKHKIVRGRFEDLEAQLVALDVELRRLSSEVQAASVLLNKPFQRALQDRCQAFAARTDVEPRMKLEGDMSLISPSQQIALLNIIHESLNNIREHAQATKVEITISCDEEAIRAEILDNGHGFELEATLMRAAREGRVGLVAINERTRLLGGQCRIDSRPGGPTVVSIALARWRPALDAPMSSSAGRRATA